MSTRSCPRRSASARDTPPLVRVKSNWATLATGENPAPVRLRGSNEGVWWMRFHRPKRRQSASTSTWPPCAVAWSELVRRRCRVDFCFVNNGMDTHHHKGDVAASTISPAIAFLFTRLRIGVPDCDPCQHQDNESLTSVAPRRTIGQMNSFFAWLVRLATLAAGSATAAALATDHSAPPHPSVYLTHADIGLAKTNIAQFAWARATADSIQRQADAWLAKPDDWFLRNVPSAGACFAYGFTGCPICGASWGTWAGVKASFDQPGCVTCAKGHTLPDADHPDSGTGWVGQDKRVHYFVGSYNAWAVETLTFQAADSLAYAYTLTGDERYAAKASLILDALAAIYPSCDKGSCDYPSHPPSGRFNRPWYQVARVLVHYVDQYDQVFPSPSLEVPSLKPGLTRRQNIEANLLKNGGAYCFAESQSGGLNNGEADYLRGALAVGVCLELPEYIRWAVDGPFGIYSMLENNLDRDGQYFETSTLYASHSRGLHLTFADPLLNYRGSAYPQGVNLYQHPKFRRFLQLLDSSLDCAGRSPRFGDSSPDTSRIILPPRPFNAGDYSCLERLYAHAEDAAGQRKLAALLNWLADGDADRNRAARAAAQPSRIASVPWLASRDTERDYAAFEERRWLMFHARR